MNLAQVQTAVQGAASGCRQGHFSTVSPTLQWQLGIKVVPTQPNLPLHLVANSFELEKLWPWPWSV